MGLNLRNVTFMTRDPKRLADFWAAALDMTERRDEQDEIVVARPGWGFPRFTFQRSEDSDSLASKLHVDLTAADRIAEIERLVALGAAELHTVESNDHRHLVWTVMRDPDGNDFCVLEEPH